MASRKKLPDHGIRAYGKTQLEFTEEKVSELRERFGFGDGPLHQYLEDVAMWYRARLEQPRPTLGNQRKLLETLRDRAEALEAVLARLGWEERRRLFDRGLSPRLLNDGDDSIRPDLRALRWAAHGALRDLEGAEPPSRANRAIRNLVYHLRRIYVHGTGRRDAYTDDASQHERFSGPFFEFVGEILSCMEVRHTNQGLGEILREIIPRADEALARGAGPVPFADGIDPPEDESLEDILNGR